MPVVYLPPPPELGSVPKVNLPLPPPWLRMAESLTRVTVGVLEEGAAVGMSDIAGWESVDMHDAGGLVMAGRQAGHGRGVRGAIFPIRCRSAEGMLGSQMVHLESKCAV